MKIHQSIILLCLGVATLSAQVTPAFNITDFEVKGFGALYEIFNLTNRIPLSKTTYIQKADMVI